MTTIISNGQTDTTSTDDTVTTVSGLPEIDELVYSTRGIPVSEYTEPNDETIDLIGTVGPAGPTGATGQRGSMWFTMSLDQNNKENSIVQTISESTTAFYSGDYILDSISSNVYRLNDSLYPEYLCNIKGISSDLYTGVVETAVSYTLSSVDRNKMIVMNNSAAASIVIKNDTASLLDVGAVIYVLYSGTSSVAVTANTGVTLVTAHKPLLRKKGSVAILTKIGANKWSLTGDLQYIATDIVLNDTNVEYTGAGLSTLFEQYLDGIKW
jgi:hypothetical protein